ncbi:MAG TPA: CBS domain-containing protein [Chthonomonadaceae bacterium]|nr:CBS domain-containing protein [Chthonomonadaceae bacterium]
MKYLTQLLDKRLISPEGTRVGKIVDAVATLGGRLPALSAVIVKTGEGETCVPYEMLEFDPDPDGPTGSGQIPGDVRLRSPLADITPYQPGDEDLRLRRDVLDKQIVDVQDYRVVRVSDVRLAECGPQYCVVGVDASLRATLRRLGTISRPIEAAARLFHKPLRSNLIAWDDVQTLEPGTAGGRIRLKVSHDKIARLHPADIADIVEQLSPQQGAEVIVSLDTETAADAIAEAEPETQAELMRQLDEETRADIIEEMEPDDAADLLDNLPDAISDVILDQMEPDDAEEVKELMAYDSDTAGGLMTTELVAIEANLTCDQTINRLRDLAPKAETIYYVYVVDDEERLVGVLSLRDLVVASPETNISDIMVRNVIHVYVEDHADEVAQIIGRYNLLAVPVVSEDEKLMGIITVDDTLERLLPPERRRRLPMPALTTDDE